MAIDNLWVMIPARGGSRGVPRKNVRLLAGVPLVVHAIRTVLQAADPGRTIVITDDEEIAAISAAEGVVVTREPETTGRATLDDVARKVADVIAERGGADRDIFLTVQPTCPFLRPERLHHACAAFEGGAASVISVVDDRHLGWRLDEQGRPVPDYRARVNRQELDPQFRETGAVIGCRLGDLRRRGTRIIEPIKLIEVDRQEALDIDDFSDWAIAQHYVSRRTIVIRADASPERGMGHAFRALAISQELAHHQVTIATDQSQPLGKQLFSQYPFDLAEIDGNDGFVKFVAERQPDLVILDQLDTDRAYVQALKSCASRVVTFEDQGSGAIEADLLVCDLYANLDVPTEAQLSGISNAILAPNFETLAQRGATRDSVEEILLLFGGTDPCNLTEKSLRALRQIEYDGRCSVVLGPGYRSEIQLSDFGLHGQVHRNIKFIPALMRNADMAISSAGRTITELISLGVPVLCLCQNDKELTHTHASARFGVINLGLGELVDERTLAAHIKRLIDTPQLRQILHRRALYETAERSNQAVMSRILEKIGW